MADDHYQPTSTIHTHPDGHHLTEHDHDHAHDHVHEDVRDHTHDHSHPDPHDNGHDHHHEHGDDHTHRQGIWAAIAHLFQPHSHTHYQAAMDPALADRRGIWALKVSLVILFVTALFQVGVVLMSGSVALLADTLHNFSDAMTALPLWLAFTLARRQRNRSYTYGYGRAEDVAGILIVLIIFGSGLLAFYESIQKIIHHQPMTNIGWVAAAAIIGFLGNEAVAIFRIRVGREIGSAALVADGLHARTDGLTSLGVLLGAVGVWLGFPLADPLMGIIIGTAILVVAWGAAREMLLRIMDVADPAMIDKIERLAQTVEGVQEVHDVSLRWIGHRQRSELHITVDCQLPTQHSHAIADQVRHDLFHAMPALVDVTVHVDPCECDQAVDYHPSSHHITHPV